MSFTLVTRIFTNSQSKHAQSRNQRMALRQSSIYTLALALLLLLHFLWRWNLASQNLLRSKDCSYLPPSSLSVNTTTSTSIAASDSLGFFDDIPDDLWKIQKQISKSRQHIHIPKTPLHPSRTYYQQNWDPDFSCSAEDKIGSMGDGHKWVCDPHRIASQQKCLIYSVGSNGDFTFERAVQTLLPNCEIHVFDFTAYKIPMGLDVTYHSFGLKPVHDENITVTVLDPYAKNTLWRAKPELDWKTFPEILTDLIDIFKIDCEGCEFYTYKDWFQASVKIRQILVEVHGTPELTDDFFSHIHSQNYVMFHKEPNIQWSGGDCLEFSFLKLNGSFFE